MKTTKELFEQYQEAADHYVQSSKNYDMGGESHVEYYRDKYPERYELLTKFDDDEE